MGLALSEKASYSGNRVGLANKIILLRKAEKELKELTAIKVVNGINGRVASMWKGAESLLFTMSQVDKKNSMNDYWNMNVYEFMRYKQLLQDYIKRTNKVSNDD